MIKADGRIANAARIGKLNTIHGHATRRTPEYEAWKSMRARCLNPQHSKFPDYGGRGIGICESWGAFENFLADMGMRPGPEYSLERVDNSKGYCSGNCKWATKSEQAINRRSTRVVLFNGESKPLPVVAKIFGMKCDTLLHRLNAGMTLEQALAKPMRKSPCR